jgi:hypothetical protein
VRYVPAAVAGSAKKIFGKKREVLFFKSADFLVTLIK